MTLSLRAPVIRYGPLALAVILLMLNSSASAQVSGRRSASDVHVRIETDRTTYRVEDSIMVRLTLRNISDQPVGIIHDAPLNQVRLLVSSAAGHKVERAEATRVAQHSPLSTRTITLKARGELTLLYKGREWMSLRDWNYDLRKVGQYTIVGIPVVGSHVLTPDYETVRSNEATFTIEP